MAIYSFEGKTPQIDRTAYAHESATITGDVVIGGECFIGAGAILRGDYGRIRIGSGTAIEEGCIVHAPPDEACDIGSSVTVGHGAIVHCSRIEDFAIIGMGAALGIHAVIGEWAIVGEGAIVTQNQSIPPRKVAVGNPARVIGDINEESRNLYTWGKNLYVELCSRYHRGLKRL